MYGWINRRWQQGAGDGEDDDRAEIVHRARPPRADRGRGDRRALRERLRGRVARRDRRAHRGEQGRALLPLHRQERAAARGRRARADRGGRVHDPAGRGGHLVPGRAADLRDVEPRLHRRAPARDHRVHRDRERDAARRQRAAALPRGAPVGGPGPDPAARGGPGGGRVRPVLGLRDRGVAARVGRRDLRAAAGRSGDGRRRIRGAAARPVRAGGAGMTAARRAPDPVVDEQGAAALRISGLAKSFGDTAAVSDVQLTVGAGSFLGLVGPNGAGKTTLLSMAIGLLRPDRGTAFVLGQDVWSKAGSVAAKQLIGALPDGLALPQRLTGAELLTYLGLLRGMPAGVVRDRTAELINVLDLAHAGRTLIADYSTGMRKKIGLASALLHGPRVLVLDEPFEAVDPVSAAVVRAILDGFIAAGGTVVMSTHVMALVEQVCDQVAVMAHGRILRTGTLSAVRGGQTLEAAFAELVGAAPARGLSWFAS